MGKGAGEEDWDAEEKHGNVVDSQPKKAKEERSSGGGGCPTCCIKTRNCLMSAECGRALQISSVVAMCGMCLRMFVCKCRQLL